jgi:hypothetical protein
MTWSTALRDIAADIHKGAFSMATRTRVWRRLSCEDVVAFIAHPVVHPSSFLEDSSSEALGSYNTFASY